MQTITKLITKINRRLLGLFFITFITTRVLIF